MPTELSKPETKTASPSRPNKGGCYKNGKIVKAYADNPKPVKRTMKELESAEAGARIINRGN